MAEAIGALILAGATVETAAGTATVASLTLFGTSLTVGTIVGTAAILGTSIAIAFATQPKVPSASDGSQPIKQAIPPRPFGYGRMRLAGAYMFFEVTSATNASMDVLALHQGKIAQVVHIYLNDDIVELDGSDFVINVLNGEYGNRYKAGASADDTLVQYRLGLPTETVYAEPNSSFPTLWTTAHRGDGIASLYLRCTGNITQDDFVGCYPRGLPKPSVVADLSPIWDPRDGGQDPDDPDTWLVSSNPVLQLLDYLTDADRGLALDYDTLIAPVIDAWMAEADICDDAVDKADGSTEPRYRSDGWAFMSTDPAEIIGAILATCDGWLAEAGDGTLSLRVGRYTASDIILTDDHIFGFSIDKGVADEELINEVQFSYTAPQANWRDCPGVSMRDETSIAETGVVRSQMLQLPWVQSHSQGRRLAKRQIARQQAPARGQLVTGLYGLKALGQRWVRVQSRQISDLSDAVIEVSKVHIDLANARLTFDWTLVNPNSIDAWDPATEEGVPPNYFPVPANVTLGDGGAGAIQVEFDKLDPEQPWLFYVVDYRVGSSGPWTRQLFYPNLDLVDIGGGRVQFTTSAVAPGTYSVRIAATGVQVVPDGVTVLDPDLVWAPSVNGSSVVIS
jgi:hypothetical protein